MQVSPLAALAEVERHQNQAQRSAMPGRLMAIGATGVFAMVASEDLPSIWRWLVFGLGLALMGVLVLAGQRPEVGARLGLRAGSPRHSQRITWKAVAGGLLGGIVGAGADDLPVPARHTVAAAALVLTLIVITTIYNRRIARRPS
jgi:hypothetical protein